MPIHVHARMYINDDGKLAEEIKTMIDTSLKDSGCLGYSFYQNLLDKTQYIMVEKWESKEQLDAHMKTAHFAKLGEYMKKVSLKPMELEIIVEPQK